MCAESLDPESIMFLRFDTAVPAHGMALAHWRIGVHGDDVLLKLATQSSTQMASTCIPPEDLAQMECGDTEVYKRLRNEIECAPLIVTYKWQSSRGFSQKNVLSSLFDVSMERTQFEPWPVLDVFDVERLWRGGKLVVGPDVSTACASAAVGAGGGPMIGSLSEMLGSMYSTQYDLKGSRQMMFGLVEVFKHQARSYPLYTPR
jgi:hypothetical protein